METKKLKFLIVKTKEQGIFISDNVENSSYFNSRIPNLFFDGEKLQATYKQNWYILPKLPEKIQKKGSDTYINSRYEIKVGFPISELTPKIIMKEDWDDDSEISGLYIYKYDTIEGSLEDVEFDMEILSEEENFYVEKPKYKATPSFMTALTTHPALHSERPCSISGKDLYTVIRNHVKLNINPKYATITSDYDFCLTVQKVILHEPESYSVNVGKRKPKYETRYRRQRTVKIFETSPEGYSNYPKQVGITAKNQKELEEKIDQYLEDLMKKINEPLVDCECCKGLGVILDKN